MTNKLDPSIDVSLRDYLMDTINERDRKYEQRFSAVDNAISSVNSSIKEALAVALANTKDALDTATGNTREALQTANSNINAALGTLDKRFDAMTTFQEKLNQQQIEFQEKMQKQQFDSFGTAVIKTEGATEKRFDSVALALNELRTLQAPLVRKSEVDIQFSALNNKLDTAVSTLQTSEGRRGGQSTAVAWVISGLSGVIAMLLLRVAGH